MTEPQKIFALATILAAAGLWLMLPRGGLRGRFVGIVLGLSALGFWCSKVPLLAHWVDQSVFWILAGVTVAAAVATISFANPVYSAIWFAMSLLGTAGLFLYQGAQFLAMATIVVYAGAILVTFLFVLMLAQPRGFAYYDRASWESLISAATGAVLVGVMSVVTYNTLVREGQRLPPPATAERLSENVLSADHVAKLGSELFGRHLIAVEVTGVLLMAALVGAAAICGCSHNLSSKPDDPTVLGAPGAKTK